VLIARVRGLIGRNPSEQELDDELRFHLEMRVEDLLRTGLPPEEARAAALRDFGGVESTKERYRETRAFMWVENSVRDVVYGSRSLARDWAFSVVAVLSLTLGIGGNTSIFSLMDTVLFRSLPVHNPAQLRFIRKTGGRFPASYFSLPYYLQMRNHRELADDMLAFFDAAGTLQVSVDASDSRAQPEVVHAQLVSGNYFSVLGVRPIVGRALPVERDSAKHSEPLAVISYSYWHRRFRGAPTAVGAKILINGNPFTVIGVTPPEFAGLTPGAPPDITAPLTLQPLIWLEPGTSVLSNARFGWLRLLLRLRAEIPEQAARAGLSVISRQIDESLGVRAAAQRRNDVGHIELLPGERGLDALRLRFSKPLLVLMALVGFVLLAACANIAVLLLARAANRQHEIGTRLALGATSGRLMRQLLAESSVIAVAGSLLGLLFAYSGSEFLLKLLADSPIPIRLTFTIDGHLLAFVAALTVLTALICGLFPAMQAIKLAIASSFWRGGRAGKNSRPGHARFSRWKVLVVFQIALSLVLLVAAGLFIGTLKNLQEVDAGFEPHDLLLVTVDPSLAGYHEPLLSNAYAELLSRMRQIPGVASATMTSHSLVSPGIDDAGFTVPGRTPKPGEPRGVNLDLVASDFFETMRVPVVLGRGIMPQDGDTNYRVAVITESIAKQYFRGENPIGKHASVGGPPIEIVGVTQDIKFNSLHDEGSRVVYVPYLQRPTWHPAPSQMTFALRTVEPHSDALASTVRQLMSRYDRDLPITSIKTAERQITESLVQERLLAWLSVGFGVLGLTLACVGVAGTMADATASRRNEIGIRMAIGAQRSNVIWTFLKEALGLSVAGSLLGLLLAHVLSKSAISLLFAMKAIEPGTMALAALLLIISVIGAALIPAWRASRVDPVRALRCE